MSVDRKTQAPDAREIALTKGKIAIVDANDYERVVRFRWYAYSSPDGRWYARSEVPNRDMHRYVLDAPQGLFVDHKNGDGLDNRRSNLRLATPAQNSWNRNHPPRSNSGFWGVTFHRRRGKWQAQLTNGDRNLYLGLFDTAEEAARVRDAAARELRGEFATLNFKEPA